MSDTEKTRLQETPQSDRCKVFYTYWTRKEAFLKSIGTGLAVDPREISVLKQLGQSDWVMQPNQYIDSRSQWSLLDLNLGAGYAASLAVEGTDFQIKYWKW